MYIEADGGSYISDYLNTYSYGRNSPDLVSDIVSGRAFQVVSGGDVDSTNWNIVNSYGLSEYH